LGLGCAALGEWQHNSLVLGQHFSKGKKGKVGV